MCRWGYQATFSSNSNVLSRLYRKVRTPLFVLVSHTYIIFRVLLATIKQLGLHPCNRCTITKIRIRELGSANDMKSRKLLRREDTQHRREDIELTRKWIFERGYPVNSRHIEKKIGENSSMVPNLVSSIDYEKLYHYLYNQNAFSRGRMHTHEFC